MSNLQGPQGGRPEAGFDGGSMPPGDPRGLFEHLEMMRRRLNESPAGVDYNRLGTPEKQAVLALVEADEARLRSVGGRTHVVRKGRNWITQFLSMGSHS